MPGLTFWAKEGEDEADDAESEFDVSVVANRPKMREVRLIARTPQPTRSWCGPDHGVGMRRRVESGNAPPQGWRGSKKGKRDPERKEKSIYYRRYQREVTRESMAPRLRV